MTNILSGIRVLDLSRVLSGPWCTQMLGDFGADVIKIERPGTGDDLRDQGARLKDTEGRETGERSTFLSTNRAKRSVTVDIAKPEGQALIRRLAETADVLVENFKAGDLRRYGLHYEALAEINPRLVYCSISGFGQDGPYAQVPGYDLIFQAMGGVMALTGVPDGKPGAGPQRAGFPVSDLTGGFYATIGVLAALLHRERSSGRGQYIDLSMFDATVAATSSMAMSYLVAGQLPVRVGLGSQLTAPYSDFDCADGKIMIAVGNDKQFVALAKVLGHPEWAEDPRFATTPARVTHRDTLLPLVAGVLATQSLTHWMPLMRAAVVPASPIHDFRQVYDDPQVQHRRLKREVPHPLAGTMPVVANPLNFSETPLRYEVPPPLLGQHTDEVLRELLQLSDDELAQLRAQKVIAA